MFEQEMEVPILQSLGTSMWIIKLSLLSKTHNNLPITTVSNSFCP